MNRADDLQFDSSVLYCITATESDLHSATVTNECCRYIFSLRCAYVVTPICQLFFHLSLFILACVFQLCVLLTSITLSHQVSPRIWHCDPLSRLQCTQ